MFQHRVKPCKIFREHVVVFGPYLILFHVPRIVLRALQLENWTIRHFIMTHIFALQVDREVSPSILNYIEKQMSFQKHQLLFLSPPLSSTIVLEACMYK